MHRTLSLRNRSKLTPPHQSRASATSVVPLSFLAPLFPINVDPAMKASLVPPCTDFSLSSCASRSVIRDNATSAPEGVR
jgi:hypothetical protein